jgi:hypothetical protein
MLDPSAVTAAGLDIAELQQPLQGALGLSFVSVDVTPKIINCHDAVVTAQRSASALNVVFGCEVSGWPIPKRLRLRCADADLLAVATCNGCGCID